MKKKINNTYEKTNSLISAGLNKTLLTFAYQDGVSRERSRLHFNIHTPIHSGIYCRVLNLFDTGIWHIKMICQKNYAPFSKCTIHLSVPLCSSSLKPGSWRLRCLLHLLHKKQSECIHFCIMPFTFIIVL